MKKPKISLVASAVRPHLWERFYKSLIENEIEFEVIFVGNVKPDFSLPKNFHYIYSNVKPAQCYEIGFRQAKGELIHWTADDAVYNHWKGNNLDEVYKFYGSLMTTNLIVAISCLENGSLTSDGHHIHRMNSPLMAPFGFISRGLMNKLGGYDRRFIAGQAENDLVMRAYEHGARVEICRNAIVRVDHNKAHTEATKIREWYQESRAFLEKCWFKDKETVSLKRLLPFERFSDENILTVSQEPKGEW